MGFKFGDFYIGGLSNVPGYSQMLAQAHRSVEQQLAYMKAMAQAQPDLMSALLGINYQPPNLIPWEVRYADFCSRLDRATSSPRPLE